MRPPLQVLITVDTEFWPRTPSWSGADVEHHVKRDIHGWTSKGEFGLGYQMDRLEEYGLKGVFFVESLFASALNMEILADIVTPVHTRGHEVQLHLHPEWLHRMSDPIVSKRSCKYMWEFDEKDQAALIAQGLENLKAAGAPKVNAFRAGNYGVNRGTLRALAKNGITYDTSYNFCYLDMQCNLRFNPPLYQPQMAEGVCEVPISFFRDYPGHYRHAQICATSFAEMRRAMIQAWNHGWRTFVVVSHSFELLRRNRSQIPNAPDSVVIKRFKNLCRFLGENGDRFQTVGFSDLDPNEILQKQPPNELQSNIFSTTYRIGEQFARRLRL